VERRPDHRLRPERDWAKARLRHVGELTSSIRVLPDFLIIGAKRGGTTSMSDALTQHPDVLPLFPKPQNIKGVHFFDSNYERGVRWYRSHFATRARRWMHEWRTGRRPLSGDASPYYLFHPRAAERARDVVPQAKIIVLLRNPIDRAYSHYRERLLHNVEPLSFRDAVDREGARLAGEEERLLEDPSYKSWQHEHHSYVAQSLYLPALRRWMDAFPRERFLILLSEDVYEDPEAAFRRTLEFLDLRPFPDVRFPKLNYNPGAPLEADVRARLEDVVAEHNRELARFLDLDLARWGP
jgi:hypothetical protein